MSGKRIKWLRKVYLKMGFLPQSRSEWRWFKRNYLMVMRAVVAKYKGDSE